MVRLKALSLKSPGKSVPKYRFHHVEISKNILSPNTPLQFIPHIRDLEDDSEDKKKFDQWIEELESMERKSGFDSTKRVGKWAATRTAEVAKTVSGYLDYWIMRLGIDNCSRATLIRYMATEVRNSDGVTPQQKSSLLSSYGEDAATPRATMVARMFTEAFNRVLKSKRVTLYDVLKQDEAVENAFDPKKATKSKDLDKEPSVEQIQQYLGTYTSLACMICGTHSCEHGEFDAENVRRCFSIDDLGGKLSKYVERRRERQDRDHRHPERSSHFSRHTHGLHSRDGTNPIPERTSDAIGALAPAHLHTGTALPCKNKCYRFYDVGELGHIDHKWTDNETNLLRSLHFTLANSSGKVPCVASAILGLQCFEVYKRMKAIALPVNVRLPSSYPDEVPAVKPVSWYDRHRKILIGDWSDHTYTHLHALREQREPCNHEGPCTAARGCPCVEAKLLCERFCQCTAESCAYKFTGCACHGSGKTCYERQKESRPCICVLLNRECDPVLCGGCGALERADPENRDNDELHATGCQNVALQRGKFKALVLGQSQLEGCGYGLFAAEDIGADVFVIEYVGELITHDEGVRREARRGDVFNQESNASYLFTLLEQDGIWVDAAIYGNLSRYINHASESDKRGCNITPKILYVNGEFRIRFTAMRDIRAGEELFFNYGENFPNLTKQLLEDKASASDDNGVAGGTASASARSGQSSTSVRRRVGTAAGSSSGRGGAKRSAYNRRKPATATSAASTKSAESSSRPGNGRTKGGGSSSNNNRRRETTAGARKEAPVSARPEVVESIDDDADLMDVDDATPQLASRATRRNLKRKRQIVYEDDGDDEHEGTGQEDNRAAEVRRNSQQARSTRRTRRQAEGATAAAPETTTSAAQISTNAEQELDIPSPRQRSRSGEMDAGGNIAISTDSPRRLQRRARLLQEEGDTTQNNDADIGAGEPLRKRRRTSPNRHSANGDSNMIIDSDDQLIDALLSGRQLEAETDWSRRGSYGVQPPSPNTSNRHARKPQASSRENPQRGLNELAARNRRRMGQPRSNSNRDAGPGDEGDDYVVAEDVIAARMHGLAAADSETSMFEPLSEDETAADVANAPSDAGAADDSVAPGTTDDDQGNVLSAGQFYGQQQQRQQRQGRHSSRSAAAADAAARTSTSQSRGHPRRHVVADSDDDVESESAPSASGGRRTGRRAAAHPRQSSPTRARPVTRVSMPRTPDSSHRRSVARTRGSGRHRDEDDAGTSSAGHSSSVDRSQRKRQKPARYRTDSAQ